MRLKRPASWPSSSVERTSMRVSRLPSSTAPMAALSSRTGSKSWRLSIMLTSAQSATQMTMVSAATR